MGMRVENEEIATITKTVFSTGFIDATTHIYSKDSIDTVHVIKTRHNFPDHRVEPGAQTTTCYNTRVHFSWVKIDLSSKSIICYYHLWNKITLEKEIQLEISCPWGTRFKINSTAFRQDGKQYLLARPWTPKMYPSWAILVNNYL